LAFGIIKAAIACHTGMATFAEAKVARGGEL
jgi:NaMN:DMB phosphoribosyltransferase